MSYSWMGDCSSSLVQRYIGVEAELTYCFNLRAYKEFNAQAKVLNK